MQTYQKFLETEIEELEQELNLLQSLPTSLIPLSNYEFETIERQTVINKQIDEFYELYTEADELLLTVPAVVVNALQ